MSSKKKEKSPYGDHSIEDVVEAEAGKYYIQLGDDMFVSETGKIAFNRERIEYFFDRLIEGLRDMVDNGTEEEKENAHNMLLNIRIYPLRIH